MNRKAWLQYLSEIKPRFQLVELEHVESDQRYIYTVTDTKHGNIGYVGNTYNVRKRHAALRTEAIYEVKYNWKRDQFTKGILLSSRTWMGFCMFKNWQLRMEVVATTFNEDESYFIESYLINQLLLQGHTLTNKQFLSYEQRQQVGERSLYYQLYGIKETWSMDKFRGTALKHVKPLGSHPRTFSPMYRQSLAS